MNEAVEAVLPEWNNRDFQLLYVTGDVHYEKIKDSLAELNLGNHISVQPFIYDMPKILNAVTLVVSRAGATTLAELTALGVPSILIPSPYVTANHQENNARALEKQCCNRNYRSRIKNTDLMATVDSILNDEAKLNSMKPSAKQMGRPDAAAKLVEAVLSIMK